jgi:hypothetical protein
MFLVPSPVGDILFVRRSETKFSRLWDRGIRGVASEGFFPPPAVLVVALRPVGVKRITVACLRRDSSLA